jgi:hypothetical protein
MFTASQIVAHLVGDYVLQSDWMALEKTEPGRKGWIAALVHGLVYTIPLSSFCSGSGPSTSLRSS